MCFSTGEHLAANIHQIQDLNTFQERLSTIRSRLNVIGTSLYLLENSYNTTTNSQQKKYIEKIKHELETIGGLINL